MKKLLLLLVILAGAYAGGWFYLADNIKSDIVSNIEKLNEKLSNNNGNIFYDDISVSGFPLDLNITFSNFKATGLENDQELNINTNGDTLIKFSLLSNITTVILPKEISAKVPYLNEDPQTTNVEFNNAIIELELTESPFDRLISGNGIYPKITDFSKFRRFTYKDDGAKMLNETGALMQKVDNEKIEILFDDNGENAQARLIFSINGLSLHEAYYENISNYAQIYKDALNDIPEFAEILTENDIDILIDMVKKEYERFPNEKFSYMFDISYAGPGVQALETNPMGAAMSSEIEFNINNISFISSLFSFSSSGKIEKRNDDMMPYGWFSVVIDNYDALIEDSKYDLFNDDLAFSPQFKKYLNIGRNYASATKKFLDQSAVITEGGKKLRFDIIRNKGGELMIGKLNMMQASMIASELFDPAKNGVNDLNEDAAINAEKLEILH